MNLHFRDIFLADEGATCQEAVRLAPLLKAPMLLTFQGDIGAGKTCFIRALLQAMGVQGAIKSPTYGLVESYALDALLIHHFDLYRLHEAEELDYIGFRDYFTPSSICLIEWPDRAEHLLTATDIQINLEISGEGRMMRLSARSIIGESILASYQED